MDKKAMDWLKRERVFYNEISDLDNLRSSDYPDREEWEERIDEILDAVSSCSEVKGLRLRDELFGSDVDAISESKARVFYSSLTNPNLKSVELTECWCWLDTKSIECTLQSSVENLEISLCKFDVEDENVARTLQRNLRKLKRFTISHMDDVCGNLFASSLARSLRLRSKLEFLDIQDVLTSIGIKAVADCL